MNGLKENILVDFLSVMEQKHIPTRIQSEDTLTRWDKWIQVEHQKQHVIPSILYPAILGYHLINVEYINDKPIEVHFRGNEDFKGGIKEFIPVWEGQDTTPPEGYTYRDYPDVHGRIGAFVK